MAKHARTRVPPINKKVAHRAAQNRLAGTPTGRHRASAPTTGNSPQVQQAIKAQKATNTGQGPKHAAAPKTPRAPKARPITVKHARPGMVANGTATVKLEFLAGLLLILLAPLANSNIKPDRDYVKRIMSWVIVFMILFPLSGSRLTGLVRLANATGAVLLLVIALKGTKSGFGVDVPTLLNTIVQKIQPGGGPQSDVPPPGVTRAIPGTNSTITGPEGGQQWIVGTSSDFSGGPPATPPLVNPRANPRPQ